MQSDTHRASQFYAAFQGLCRGEDDADYLTCQRQLSDAFQTPSNAAFVVEQLALILCSAPSANEEAQRGTRTPAPNASRLPALWPCAPRPSTPAAL